MKKIEELKYDKERLNKQKIHGITLIALVITIIILIILAGISLNFILGDDSIISTAVYVREKTTIESIREKLELVKGSAYINGEGKTNISKYFEQLEKEKIEPYNVTNKEKLTDLTGLVEVNEKYCYLVIFTENGESKIEYDGKTEEVDREQGMISVILEGEEIQKEIPIKLTATIINSKEEVKNAKWILTESEVKLGIQDNSYTQTTNTNTINMNLEEVKTYYLHVLTTDTYGRKVETVKGPITIASVSHTHVGKSSKKEGCYQGEATTKQYEITGNYSGWECCTLPGTLNGHTYACGHTSLCGTCSNCGKKFEHSKHLTCNHTSYALSCGLQEGKYYTLSFVN